MEFDEKSSSGGVKVKTPRGEGESSSPQLLSSPPCLSPSTLPRTITVQCDTDRAGEVRLRVFSSPPLIKDEPNTAGGKDLSRLNLYYFL
ncbi:hypothetical protein SRHO_G00041100 [Serrasalmus rhombeus]